MSDKMICTSDCVNCKYCNLHNISVAKIKVYCSIKEKEYWYGQMIPCDKFIKTDFIQNKK